MHSGRNTSIFWNKWMYTAGSGQREPPRLVLEVGRIFTIFIVYPHLHSRLIMSIALRWRPILVPGPVWPSVQWTGTLMVLVLLIWPQWAGLQDAGRWTVQSEEIHRHCFHPAFRLRGEPRISDYLSPCLV